MLLCEGILFLIGLVVFFTQKVRISGGRLVTGMRARWIALFFMLPIPLVALTGLWGAGLYDTDGVGFSDAALIEVVIDATCVLIALIIGLTSPPLQAGFTPLTPILTPEEAARYLRVPVADIHRLIQTNQLPAARVGSEYRIAKDKLDELLQP